MALHPHLFRLFEFRWVYILGFLAQILFFSRMLVQWVLSEKSKASVSPKLFWVLSVVGACLMMMYGFFRSDLVIIGGQLIGYYVYIRNLTLQDFWKTKLKYATKWLLKVAPIGLLGLLFVTYHNPSTLHVFHMPSGIFVLGAVGQIVFNGRFVYQWLYSEKRKESILPFGFWLLSFVGSVLLVIYALVRHDLVLFLGQLFGLLVYTRNVIFVRRSK